MPLTPVELVTLRAMLDRVIPRDEFPGATDAGADLYILRQLAGSLKAEEPRIAAGLAALDTAAHTRHQCAFAALSEATQDGILSAIAMDPDTTSFFNRLVELAAEGFYADPGQGGNRDAVSWRMVGYSPRRRDQPGAP